MSLRIVVPSVIGQIVGCGIFGYFAIVSFVNAKLAAANYGEALSEFGPQQLRQGRLFLRLWLAVNILSALLLTAAAVLVWSYWTVALILGCTPVFFFALANLIGSMRGKL